jgi:hypothetical protein
MPTIKTYSKGAPFYNASAFRSVGKAGFPSSDDPIYREYEYKWAQIDFYLA